MIDLMQQVLRPLAEKRWLDTWEKIVGFAGDDWFPSRLPFGKFKGRIYQEARENAAFLDLRIQEDAGGTSIAAGLVVFQQRSRGLVPRRRTKG
jgi:DNA polymerase-3 subunit epsilon